MAHFKTSEIATHYLNGGSVTETVVHFQTMLTWNEIITIRAVLKAASQLPMLNREERDIAMRFISELDHAQLDLPF